MKSFLFLVHLPLFVLSIEPKKDNPQEILTPNEQNKFLFDVLKENGFTGSHGDYQAIQVFIKGKAKHYYILALEKAFAAKPETKRRIVENLHMRGFNGSLETVDQIVSGIKRSMMKKRTQRDTLFQTIRLQ